MNEFLLYLISYSAVLIGGFIFVNWLSNGFLLILMRVKSTRGTKVLVIVKSKLQNYFIIGKVVEGFLIFRDNACKLDGRKTEKRIAIPNGSVFRMFSVNCIWFDEEINCILRPDLKGVTGFDAIKWNNILIRALKRPSIEDPKLLLIIILVICILLLFGLIAIYARVNQLQSLIMSLKTVTSNVITSGVA
jgi:hypothetical protein